MIEIIENQNFSFLYCQENEQYNKLKGILRGLHYQLEPHAQAKYCHVSKGKVLSVAVDIREKSKDFGKYISYKLDDTENKYMFIPKGYAHGYFTLSDESIFIYQVDEYFSINWKINKEQIIVSQKDSFASKFKDTEFYKGSLC